MCVCVWCTVFVPDSSFGVSLERGLNARGWTQLDKPSDSRKAGRHKRKKKPLMWRQQTHSLDGPPVPARGERSGKDPRRENAIIPRQL